MLRRRLVPARWVSKSTSLTPPTWKTGGPFSDCPGSIEFQQDSLNALRIADAAIIVVEAEPARAIMVAPLLRALDQHGVPHLIFINKVENAQARLRETLEALQAFSERPLLLRQVPIRHDDAVDGFIDLVSERAYHYRQGQPSELIQLPVSELPEEQSARQEVLEHLADFDDDLLEKLLSDTQPVTAEVFANLSRDVAQARVVPVLFGSATADHGIIRLLKSLRHDVPSPSETVKRLGFLPQGPAQARVFKTIYASHTGKLSFARIWRGEFTEGMTIGDTRPSALFAATANGLTKVTRAGIGEIVAFGRLDTAHTGDLLAEETASPWPEPLPPLFSLAPESVKKQDDVKLSSALTKLVEEDPSLSLRQDSELVLWGQGEIHLQVALEKLKSHFGLTISSGRPEIPYKETIMSGVSQHGRYKRQSGGHGQFADITLEIEPLPRGTGFQFADEIVGGVVPRQYIPAVEEGAIDTLKRGPLGFPVVDVKITLNDGGFHPVDSSDMAFKTVARTTLTEALPKCDPVLLEPILSVVITVPSTFTSKAQRVISGRRGQILGYQAKEGWKGWDIVQAFLPEAEMSDLIVELRSLTMGVGTFSWKFDHLQELTGRPAEKVVEERRRVLTA